MLMTADALNVIFKSIILSTSHLMSMFKMIHRPNLPNDTVLDVFFD